MQHNTMMVALAAAAALVTSACASAPQAGDDSTTTATQPGASETAAATGDGDGESAQVTIKSFIFDPTPLEVSPGTTVTWSNEDKILHTATSGTPDAPTDVFDIEMAEVGTSGEFTFDEAGTYDYFCSRHNTMLGQVIVS